MSDSETGWLRRLLPRLAAHPLLKLTILPLFVTGFFAAYFQLLRHPAFPVTVMPLLAPDRWIAFWPLALVPYFSLWFYAFLAPVFIRGRAEITAYAGGAVALTAVGLALFWAWPTAIPPLDAAATGHPAFGFLQKIDSAGNACPSLHVAFAVFTALWLARVWRAVGAPTWLHLANAGWCAAIAYSTMATKQHVAVDVLAGTALGLAAGLWRTGGENPDRGGPLDQPRYLAVALSLACKLLIPALALWPAHRLVAVLLFAGPDLWIIAGLLIPNATWLMPVVRRFATPRREVWLTIDDGPEPATTPRMLDLLDRHGARATFFVIGTKAAAQPDLLRAIAARGHTLGNHTHGHPLALFWLAGPRRTEDEIARGQSALSPAGAAAGPWFRAPAGIKSFFLPRVLARRDLVLVGWSGRGREVLSTSTAAPLRRLQKAIRPGAILLLHESAPHAEARLALLAALLEHVSAGGYRCVLPARGDLR